MQWTPSSAAATVGAILAFCAAATLAYRLGRTRRAWPVGWRVGAGLLIGVLCALVYWMLALAIETYWPRALDPSLVGLYFATLCLAAPISGGLGAWLGYRSSAYK